MLELAKLHIAAHHEAHGGYDRTIEDVARTWQAAADIHALLARASSGECVGFIAHRQISGDERFITDMYVRPDVRKSGIGQKLLRATLAPKSVSLTVWGGNAPAIALYEKLGFLPAGPAIVDQHGRSMIQMKWSV